MKVVEKFKMKKDNIESPEVYLGGRLEKNSFNGKEIWTISSVDYVKAIINNIKVRLTNEGMKLPARAETPMSLDYKPITMHQEFIR